MVMSGLEGGKGRQDEDDAEVTVGIQTLLDAEVLSDIYKFSCLGPERTTLADQCMVFHADTGFVVP
jgi:hypothetical protein